MRELKKIYNRLPVFVQNILITIYGYRLKKKRFNKVYIKKLKEFKKMNLIETDFKKVQLNKLNEFLLYAKKNSPYYRKKLQEIQLPIKSLTELSQLPVLKKEDIRKNINLIITKPKNKLSKSLTGGTTGRSLAVYYENEDTQERMAYLDYFKWKHGIEIGMKRASFTGKLIVPLNQKSKEFWRYNRSINQLLFSSYHTKDTNLKYYVQKLNEFKPLSLDGFPSVMVKIAKYIKINNLKLEFSPKAIFPTAETLLEEDKVLLEEVFKTKVFNQYASSEGAPFVTACELGNLHFNIETGVFEKVSKNSISKVYVTSFTTHGTPLIRYDIGDSFEFSDEKCDCGYHTPLAKRILGRNTDFLYSKNAGYIRMGISSAISHISSIKHIQFIQEVKNEIDINVVFNKNENIEKEKKEILKTMQDRLGKDMKFNINNMNELPIERSGKTRFIINRIKEGELTE